VTVFIVLGMLYESLIHPVTILSTLPSAGVGALLALIVCRIELSVISLIGIILLIGIVKKNAILMIDFALDVQRREGKRPEEAIFQACLLRFRPILMTTMAAMLGGLPLAIGMGTGSELRRPLGIAIVGAARQPAPHPVHDAGGLSLPRPIPVVVESQMGARPGFRVFGGACMRPAHRRRTAAPVSISILFAAACILATACAVGPRYTRPPISLPRHTKSRSRRPPLRRTGGRRRSPKTMRSAGLGGRSSRTRS
jgi:hypothetical protein